MPIVTSVLSGIALSSIAAATTGLAWGARVSTRARSEIEAAFPPLGGFVETAAGRLHYTDHGAGVPIVLIHGASVNLRDLYFSLREPLSGSHRVLCFDRPGYGYSSRVGGAWQSPTHQARAIREALERLGIESPILVGHSWGAALALAYALEFPRELRGVVTICGATHPWPGGVALYRYLGATPYIGRLLARTVLWPLGNRSAEAAVEFTLSPDPVPATYRAQAGIDLLFRPEQFVSDAQDVVGLCRHLEKQSTRYAELGVPLSIITGTVDRVVSPRLHSHTLHSQVRHSRLEVLHGAGHAPHHHHSREIVRVIRELVANTGANATRGDERTAEGPEPHSKSRQSLALDDLASR